MIETVSDRRFICRIWLPIGEEGTGVVDWSKQLMDGRTGAEGRLSRLCSVHDESAAIGGEKCVGGQVAIDDRRSRNIQRRDEVRCIRRQRLVPHRSSGGDEELVIQERTAK